MNDYISQSTVRRVNGMMLRVGPMSNMSLYIPWKAQIPLHIDK